MREKLEEIEKQWCVYGWFLGPWNFGKVTSDDENSVNILYSERQHYPPECWDSKWINRFRTLEEAVENYIKNRPSFDIRERNFTDDEIRNQARYRFPSYFENKE